MTGHVEALASASTPKSSGIGQGAPEGPFFFIWNVLFWNIPSPECSLPE
jgi:hypothetical protein